MKLERKHIAPYFPYGLTFLDEYKNVRELDGMHVDLSFHFKQTNRIDYFHFFPKVKPILRPLSDVPIEWFEIGDQENDSLEYDFGNIKLIKSLESLSKNGFVNDINHLPFGVVQKLLEWHFDVFGLISNGLAIDINTLTKNNKTK